jgi:hypothetical protein
MRSAPGVDAPHRRARLLGVLAVLAVLAIGVPRLVGEVSATFTDSTTVPANTISAATMFPQTMTTAAYSIYDAAAGTGETNASVHLSASDGITWGTHNWISSFDTTRYIDFTYSSPFPTGRTTSGVQFNFTFESQFSNTTGCFYLEVRRASNNALLGTHGSSGSPIACQDGTSPRATTTALPEVTSSDIANDLVIRIYGEEGGAGGFYVDLATVSGTADDSFTLQYWRIFDNAKPSNAATFDTWLLNDGDNRYITKSGWGTSFSSTQYVKWGFPSYVPSSAAVTGVTFTHSFRAGAAGTACMYFETYNGATLLGTHGSSSSPYCTSSTTTFRTDTFTLTEVDTPAKADNLIIKMYATHSDSTVGNRITHHDRATITFTYGFR